MCHGKRHEIKEIINQLIIYIFFSKRSPWGPPLALLLPHKMPAGATWRMPIRPIGACFGDELHAVPILDRRWLAR